MRISSTYNNFHASFFHLQLHYYFICAYMCSICTHNTMFASGRRNHLWYVQILGNRSGIENFTAERRPDKSRRDMARIFGHGCQLSHQCRFSVLRDYQKKPRKARSMVFWRCCGIKLLIIWLHYQRIGRAKPVKKWKFRKIIKLFIFLSEMRNGKLFEKNRKEY